MDMEQRQCLYTAGEAKMVHLLWKTGHPIKLSKHLPSDPAIHS